MVRNLDGRGGNNPDGLRIRGTARNRACPDRDGRSGNVVLGFDNLTDYVLRNPNFGTLVGRYGNRIAGGRFVLDGYSHQLACNNGATAGWSRRSYLTEVPGRALR